MRYGPRLMASCLTALIMGLSPVHAQTPPEQIRDWPGLSYLGVIGGLEAWAVEGSDTLWMRAPDGRGLIRGTMFSAAGVDLGAALLGTTPAPLVRDVDETGPDWSAPTAELLSSVIGISAAEAFSISLGAETAPEVWAWMDLSEPTTSATYMMLRKAIENGEISLRVIPVVTREAGSSDLMLKAISQPGPIQTLEDLIRGVPLPDDAERNEERLQLSEGLISRIERNGTLASRINPPGLPLFVWARPDGPSAYLGVPGPDLFEGAVRVSPQQEEAETDAPAAE